MKDWNRMNLLNRRASNMSAFGPRNLLNMAGQDDGYARHNGNYFNTPEGESPDLMPHEGNFLDGPIPVAWDSVEPTLYSSADGGGFDEGMPVFRPGEVSEAPFPKNDAQPARPEAAVAAQEPVPTDQVPPAMEADGDDEAAAVARENQREELSPFTSLSGSGASPYAKTMAGRSDKETAEIAQAQYPGATVRMGKNGRPIIKMPDGATRVERRPVTAWGDGPDYELVEVPIGGQEFQLNAPVLSMRDVANGGGQEAIKVGNAMREVPTGAKAGFLMTESPVGAVVGALVGGAKGYFEGGQVIGKLARSFKSRQPQR
jgi:hypothetical protein